MINPGNFALTIGRLTDDIRVFANKDGSRKIRFTLASEDNHKDRAGNRGTQFIPVEAFVSKTNTDNGIFDRIHKGDLIEAICTVKNNNYVDAQGVTQYQIVLFCENIKLLESKTVTDARLAGRATAANAAAPAETAPAPAPAEAAPAEAQEAAPAQA